MTLVPLESEIAALTRRLAATRQTENAAALQLAKLYAEGERSVDPGAVGSSVEARLRASGLFDPTVYLALNPDLAVQPDEAWRHLCDHGLEERRPFTDSKIVARLLAEMDAPIRAERFCLTQIAEAAFAARDKTDIAAPLRRRGTRIAVFCSSLGNFFMREIADMLAWGLQAEAIDAVQRDENANRNERFDLRIFVAPHEFFWLGKGSHLRLFAIAPFRRGG